MSVPGQGADHLGGLAAQRVCDAFGGALGVVAAGQGYDQGVAAGALDEGGNRGSIVAADYQVALPSAGLGPAGGFSRPVG